MIMYIIGSNLFFLLDENIYPPSTSKTLVPRVCRCIAVFPYENNSSTEIRQYSANAIGIFTCFGR